MKSKAPKRPDEYRALKTKLLRRAVLAVAVTAAAMVFLYASLISGLVGSGVITSSRGLKGFVI